MIFFFKSTCVLFSSASLRHVFFLEIKFSLETNVQSQAFLICVPLFRNFSFAFNMNLLIILIFSFAIQLKCQANDLLCESFHPKVKFFEKYCNNFNGNLPTKCEENLNPKIDSCQVMSLKIGGCGGEIVWQTLNHFKSVRSLDVSNSAYKVLNWLDATSFNLKRLQKFNASHNELTHLRRLLVNASALIEIDLSFNELSVIDSNSFGEHDKLNRIILSHNKITKMSLDAFKGVKNLNFIDLSDNYFRDVPSLPFSYSIRHIHLERNPIYYLNCPQTNSAMVHLTWTSILSFYGHGSCDGLQMNIIADAEHEGISTAEANYQIHLNSHSFRRLYTFIAGRNAFKNVTNLLPFLTALVTNLDLSENYVGMVNKTTFELFDRLMVLSLRDTMLRNFDFKVLRNQNRLKSLDLSNNRLEHMENISYLAKFHSLIHFNVAGNRLNNTLELIESLRSSVLKELNVSDMFVIVGELNATTFERLTSLEVLKLHNTNLSISNFDAFEMLKNLKFLDISRNNLTLMSAPKFHVLGNLTQLIKLNISNCQLRNVSDVIRALGSALRELDVSGNSIGKLHVNTFNALNHLEYLNLSNNNFSHFDFALLKNLTNLRVLDISYNKLHNANVEHLSSDLKHLYLEGNDLTEIEKITPSQFPLLESLSISKNQFPCLFLRKFLAKRRHLYLIGNSLDQKHGKHCRCSVHGIIDYLDTVYDKVRFW